MIRFLSYNIHGCVGRAGRHDPDAILEVVRKSNADVVALQEVIDEKHGGSSLLSAFEKLGYTTVVHAPTITKKRGPYGIAMLSKIEPTETQEIDLGGIEPRKAMRFHLEHPEGSLDVCNTHMGLAGSERWKQIEMLDRILADADERHDDVLQVLMGDLNEWRPRTRFMRTIKRRFPWVTGISTFPCRRPVIALDRIAIRGNPRSVNFCRINEPPADRASDHRPLLAEVEL